MQQTAEALDALISALNRRTDGLTGRQFEYMVSPSMADAFVRGWLALGRNAQDIPIEWQDLANAFAEMK